MRFDVSATPAAAADMRFMPQTPGYGQINAQAQALGWEAEEVAVVSRCRESPPA